MSARRGRWLRSCAALAAGLLLVALALFAWQGLRRDWLVPRLGQTQAVPLDTAPRELCVLSWNIAKAGVYQQGLWPASPQPVEQRLAAMAELLRASGAQLVALQEVVFEAGPGQPNQAQRLAELGQYGFWAEGENCDFGLPGLCLRSGNALLAKFPLRGGEVQALAGARPFWNPSGRRRALWCELDLGGAPLLVAALRLDSFELANNAQQVRELLAHLGQREALLAGDFNAEPGSPPLALWSSARSWSGQLDGPPTFPSQAPTRRIDYVLAPASWTLIDEVLLPTALSDHLPVLARFALP